MTHRFVSSRITSRVISLACVVGVGMSSGAARAHGGGGHGGGGHSGGGGGGHSGGGGSSFGGGGFGPRSAGAAYGGFIFGGAVYGGGGLEGSSFVGRTFPDSRPRREEGAAVDFGRFGGTYASYLYVGPTSTWSTAHWGSGFWAARSTEGWAWYTGQWFVTPEYPGWVWMGPPWVWDGVQMVSQDGYWTFVNLPAGAPLPDFVEVEPK